jgi:hypothetical protein
VAGPISVLPVAAVMCPVANKSAGRYNDGSRNVEFEFSPCVPFSRADDWKDFIEKILEFATEISTLSEYSLHDHFYMTLQWREGGVVWRSNDAFHASDWFRCREDLPSTTENTHM